MGHARVHHVYNAARMHAILRSPTGGLAKDMVKRGIRVQTRARENLQRPPQRVNTGLLRASIQVQLIYFHGYPAVRVGTSVSYALFVHEGTGLYGPKHHLITPHSGKFLVFKPQGSSHLVFARSVRGMRPNPFLKDALAAARY